MSDPNPDLTATLARELFKRAPHSAVSGAMGVPILAYPHIGIAPASRILAWALCMVSLFMLRAIASRHHSRRLQEGAAAAPLLALDVLNCAAIGTGWVSTAWLFDTQAMDQNFYLRFLLLAAAMAFIVLSTGMLYRSFLAYSLPMSLGGVVFLIGHDYVQPTAYVASLLVVYQGMLLAMARVSRQAVIDHRDVKVLSEGLSLALAAEKQLREELSLIARVDDLTGVLNRRGILEALAREVDVAARLKQPLAVLMLDIDRFKSINDSHGHACGDAVIRSVASRTSLALQPGDVLGRLGGDELLAILPGHGVEAALHSADHIRRGIESLVIDVQGQTLHATLSIGVACLQPDDDAVRLLARVDGALYGAKGRGRNRVHLGPDSVGSGESVAAA